MISGEKIVERPISRAMIGGGRGSQIGYIQRSAALRDANFEFVAGAFDINPERGKDFGKNLHVAPRPLLFRLQRINRGGGKAFRRS